MHVGLRTEDQRQVQLVDHQPLARHLAAVALLDFMRKAGNGASCRIAGFPAPNYMGP
jgi:hypothetical protein